MTDLNQRISELEIRIVHQDATIQDLSDMTTQQWDAIEQLKKELRDLKSRIVEIEESAKSPGGEEPPPPHY